MKKSLRKPISGEDDATPVSAMIDIVFLLLIYFILTQKPIIEDTLLDFSPATKGASNSRQVVSDFVSLELSAASGECLFNGQKILIRNLHKYLSSIASANNSTKIVVFCADEVKHSRLVEILDICRQLKLKNISIMAK